MDKFLEQHRGKISGALSCFDRVLFRGYLPIMNDGSDPRVERPKEPNHLVEWRGSTFFTARDDASPARELWRTDGTEGGTVRLRDVLGVPTGSDPVGLGPYRGMLFWAVAGDPLHGIELWATDGTGAGTGMLGDIRAGSGNGLPRASRQGEIVFGLGDRVYFVGSDGMSGDELWAYRVAKE